MAVTNLGKGLNSPCAAGFDNHQQTAMLQTCSFVVRPRETRTIWKPVRPTIGIHSRPIITI